MAKDRSRPSRAKGFEISDADPNTAGGHDARLAVAGTGAFALRGEAVMLAVDVALIFGVETREIVQNIKSNPDMFPERYAFELTLVETEALRSAGLMSKPGRGGSRALPWVVTRKGAIRLATIMKSPRAIEAADTFVDVFDEVVGQIQMGAGQLTIANPSRVAATEHDVHILATIRERLAAAMNSLFETVVDTARNTTVADELQELSAEGLGYIKAWLRRQSTANEKIEAETMLLIEQARDMYERRQAELADKALDRERKALENVRIRIAVAQELLAMYQKLEPSAAVALTSGFASVASVLPGRSRALPKKGGD